MTSEPLALVRSVLVCDDREELRDAIRLLLADHPRFTIEGNAADGASCLEQVRDTRPDVLILDVNMPGGGPDLARAVKQLSPATQILVYSSNTTPGSEQHMRAAGADDYIVKTGRTRPLIDGLTRAADRLR